MFDKAGCRRVRAARLGVGEEGEGPSGQIWEWPMMRVW